MAGPCPLPLHPQIWSKWGSGGASERASRGTQTAGDGSANGRRRVSRPNSVRQQTIDFPSSPSLFPQWMSNDARHSSTVHPKAGKARILPFHCLFEEGICEAIWTVPSLPPLFSGCPCFLPPILPLHGWMDEAGRGRERASSRPDGLMSKEPKKSNASIYL